MKIVIVENPRPLTLEHYNDVANAPLSASLNSGYALAVSRRAGWEAVHLDFTSHAGDAAGMAGRIQSEEADLILFHWVYAWGHETVVRDLLELLCRERAVPLGAFGIFPTLARQRLMQYSPHLDFILNGEFEDTLADLLQDFSAARSIRPLPGVALRDHPVAARPLIGDLAHLPLPDDVGNNRGYPSLNIAASRGCFGQCSFCFIRSYYGCGRRRVRPPASLERELETRLARRDIRSIYFVDPTFIGHGGTERKRAVEIGRMAQRFGLPFGFETRVDTIDAGVMEILAAHGAESVFLGIESGCDSVLQRIGKRIGTEQIRRAVQTVRRSGVRLNLGFIMFEPDTCLAELEENYAFLEELELLDHHELTANLLYHNQIVLHGSMAWRRFKREKRLLLDERLPFEARYRFRDERVGLVCAAMGRLSAAYFGGMDTLRGMTGTAGREGCGVVGSASHEFSPDDVNALLKEAFQSLCAAAGNLSRQRFTTLEEGYRHSLLNMLS
ncbi:MAG: radical SAM protein [Oryzomonas sp.]|uniref:B12-binding domain-containing radical SAM protein n=1 Tax=Oryzomonas sp. TaxID=2855186 RepID=UPI00283AF77E|nr:radical SAM protein [Oryzomonas sp.]MDR3579957.1 radical SAM protein [Oryzomonas sp.]